MRASKILSLLTVCVMTLGSSAAAQTQSVTGKITDINREANQLTLQPDQRPEGIPARLELFVSPDADLRGVPSLRRLNIGDEVRVDVERRDAWFANSLETAPAEPAQGERRAESERDEAATAGFFERAFARIQHAWFGFRHDVRSDPGVYQDYAQDRIALAEERLRFLRNEAAGRAQDELREADIQLEQAKNRLEQLRQIEPWQAEPAETAEEADVEVAAQRRQLNEAWREARSDLDETLNETHNALLDAAKEILSERQIYGWETENELQEMRYDIREVRVASQDLRTEQDRSAVERNIREMEQALEQAERRFETVKAAGEAEWREHRSDVRDAMNTFRSSYYGAAAKVRA